MVDKVFFVKQQINLVKTWLGEEDCDRDLGGAVIDTVAKYPNQITTL